MELVNKERESRGDKLTRRLANPDLRCKNKYSRELISSPVFSLSPSSIGVVFMATPSTKGTAQNATRRQSKVKNPVLKLLNQVRSPYYYSLATPIPMWSCVRSGSGSLFNRFNMKKRVQQTAKG